jgi:isoleucyl-tRNA synthetase
MWSPVERTALAEAEIEYHDKNSPQIWVKFPVVKGPEALIGARVVIWTTTPWTIPGNRAVSYSPSIAYGVYEAEGHGRLVVADNLAGQMAKDGGVAFVRVAEGERLEIVRLGARCPVDLQADVRIEIDRPIGVVDELHVRHARRRGRR